LGDTNKTKKQLLDELAKLHQRIVDLEALEDQCRRAEGIAQEAIEYAESVVETVREPLLVLDDDLRIISANRSFLNTFEVSPEETVGQMVYEIGDRQWDIPRLRELLEEILPKKTSFDDFLVEHDFEIIGRKTMLLNARRLYKEGNHTHMILLAIEDITERRKMEKKLERYREHLEELVQERTRELESYREHLEELVQERTRELEEAQGELMRKERLAALGQLAGSVSHELRNPLGAVKNAAYLINMIIEQPEPELKESLDIINREVDRSDRIITSILSFARPMPPELHAVNINEVIREALSHTDVPQGVEVVSRLDDKLPAINADHVQLGQVFGNLILNAVQSMPQGGRLTISSKAVGTDKVAVSIEDSGEGIPGENLEKLFEPLFSTRAKGIGLGLPIAKDMVERNKGTIEVQSEEGKGTTFTVKLPLTGEKG
jgi:two-component system cell cycle sensor histidine kinase PleC